MGSFLLLVFYNFLINVCLCEYDFYTGQFLCAHIFVSSFTKYFVMQNFIKESPLFLTDLLKLTQRNELIYIYLIDSRL